MRFAILLAALSATTAAAAEKAAFAVVEKVAGEVGFYSADWKRLFGVKVGTHPHEIVLSLDRKSLYVSDNGILWMQYAGDGGNTISVIDIASRTRTGVIDLGSNRRPHGLAVHPKSGLLLSTTENPDGLLLIDPVNRKVIRRFDVKGEDPHMVMFGPGGDWAYVSNTATAAIAALRPATGDVKLIPTDARPQGGVLSPDGKVIYMTNSDGNSISLIDPVRHERIGRIETGKGPGRIALTPDGKFLIYNLQAGEAVGWASIAGKRQVAQIPLGGKPLSLTLSPDGKWAYVGLQEQDQIAVVSVAERKIARLVNTPKGSGPDPVLPLP